MRPHIVSKLTAILLLAWSSPAFSIVDDYSTAAGAGGPDELDDVWQAVFNGWGLSATGDEDSDGCSNLLECIAGTDPRKGGDCHRVGNTVLSASNVVFTFEAEAGKKYRVLSDDSPGGAFTTVVTQVLPVNGQTQYIPAADTPGQTISVAKAPSTRKFYRLEVSDADSDNDGITDWAERRMGTDVTNGTSPANASGGAASDLATLKSLFSIQVSPGATDAFEKEGTKATVRVQRSVGTMPLTIKLVGEPGAVAQTQSSAAPLDYVFQNNAGVATDTVLVPSNQGTTAPYEVAKVAPVADSSLEVPEALKVCVTFTGAPPGTTGPATTVKINDANPTDTANRTLYVAFLGREAGAASTASGYATALVEGDNNKATVSVVFNNLSSDQNTCYIRVGPDLEVLPLPLGQVSGANWNIRAAQTEITDQAMLNALKDGKVYLAVTTVNFPDKEIWGYFNRASGSVLFDPNNDDLLSPTLGSALWQTPTGDALEREIWRFMSQATFGGTTALYNEIRAEVDAAISGGGTYVNGLSNWMDKQMDLAQAPQISLRQLMMAADMEEFALRGNKPITYASDPQLNGGSIPVTYVNGMPTANVANPNTNDPGNNYPVDSPNRRREWWTMILQSKDHLRQRVAQALHEITVISERDATVLRWGYGAANYWDMLASNAFGKYRTLLENVSLNPMMGVYLTSVSNRAAYDAGGGLIVSPDENYAREIMQLFSIGLVLRHPDGSLQLSSEGLPISTYDNNDITELARVFTGFSHGARHGNATTQIQGQYGAVSTTTQRISPAVYFNGSANNTWFGRDDGHLYWQAPWNYQMKVIGRISPTVYHDFNPKTLLAGKHGELIIPSFDVTGQTDTSTHAKAAEEVSKAHDSLAGVASAGVYGAGTQGSPGHTNTPVNISRWLIQRLVTSNPSAGYIYRVQKAYRDGNGLLGPVVKAILLDYEARSTQLSDSSISSGKVKEPLVHFAGILRQFRAFSGAPVSLLRDMSTGFAETDAPLTGGYPSTELAKFSTANTNPPSKPTGWADGPFRIRIDSLRTTLGQSPQDAPSVFNWFLPDFVVPGSMAQAGLFAPELQIATESNEVSKINHLYNYTWMSLAGMTAQPGVSGADFIFRNGWATPAVRFSTNGGTTLMGWPASITLDSTNWNTGVSLTMVGVNDQKFDQMASTTVRYAVSGSAAGYAGIATPSTPVTFVENEKKNEQLFITPTGGNTWVQEAGGTDAVAIMLSCPPAAGTTVNVTLASINGEVTFSSGAVSFTDANWNVPQSVTITAIDDADVEDAGPGGDQVTFTTTSTAANFDGILTAPLSVGVVDNDNAYGVQITQSGGTTDVMETNNTSGTGTDSYTIVLTKAPTADVVVNCVSNGQLGINTPVGTTTFTTTTATRTFTPANWNIAQSVVVRGNNDTTNENNHTGTITHTIAAASGGYATTLPIQQVVATVVDDDNSIIVAHVGGGETRVMEGGDLTDTITVRLRSNPNAQVSVTLGALGLKFTPSAITFDPTGGANPWNTDQVVTVTALDDSLNEGLHTSAITAYSTSSGTNYNGSTGGTALPATIIDNDDARVILTQSGGSTLVNEDGTTDSYTLALGRKPKPGTVTTVSLSPSTTGIQVTPAGPFAFDENNWNTAVTVAVTTTNDGTAETRGTATITHNVASTDPVYDRSSTPVVLVTIDDNDPPLTLAQTNIFTQVKEGGTAGTAGTPNAQDTFTVLLPRAPATGATVTVTLVPNSQITLSPSVLTFTSATTGTGAYTIAQTVTVSAADDGLAEPTLHTGVVGFNIASTDVYFNGIAAPPVIVQVTDNDSPGVSIVESGNTTAVTEGSATTDTYTVALTQAPTADTDVVVNGGTQLLVSKTGTPTLATATLNFTPANWAAPQMVNVLPNNDTVAELRHLAPITHTISGTSAPEYLALTGLASVTGIITDNDNTAVANVVRITESSGTTGVTESGATVNGVTSNADTFTVVLSAQPTANVTVTFTADSQLTVTPATLTFVPGATGAGTFNVAQTVTIRSVDDKILEPILHWGTVTATVSSADLTFDAKPVTPVTSSVYDNDGPSVNIIASGGSTSLTENGVTDTYTISLGTEPTADVVVTLTPDTQLTANVGTLTFTGSAGAAPWNVPQTVTLTAVNDALAETVTHNGLMSHSMGSADPLYNGMSIPTHIAQIWDNDVPSLDISHAGTDTTNTTITEGGANDTILIKLNQAPAPGTSVTITLYPPAFFVPPPQIGKTSGYFVNDLGSSNQRDNIVIDYSESIQLYRDTFYAKLRSEYGGTIPSPFPTTPTAADNIKLQNSHWAATRAMIDKLDLWFSGGSLKARNPVLVEPNQPVPVPRPPVNPRQTIMEAIYALNGGNSLPNTTRYTPEIVFNPKSPPTDTFSNEVRDRARWAGYLMTVAAPGLVAH